MPQYKAGRAFLGAKDRILDNTVVSNILCNPLFVSTIIVIFVIIIIGLIIYFSDMDNKMSKFLGSSLLVGITVPIIIFSAESVRLRDTQHKIGQADAYKDNMYYSNRNDTFNIAPPNYGTNKTNFDSNEISNNTVHNGVIGNAQNTLPPNFNIYGTSNPTKLDDNELSDFINGLK